MARVIQGKSITSRRDAGAHILAAAKTIATKAIAPKLKAFAAAHAAYGKADEAVKKANATLAAQMARVGEADVVQDECVEHLASVLVAEGLPRTNPFKPFGVPAPSKVVALGYAVEAAMVTTLCAAIRKKKLRKKETVAAVTALLAASKTVVVSLGPVKKLQKARDEAVAVRNALELGWETAFASLRRAARAAEDDGFTGYEALFGSAKPKGKRAPKAAPTPPPVP